MIDPNEYKTDANGRITSPGKFEGEMAYAPYFYSAHLDGGADVDVGGWLFFTVSDEDRQQWPTFLDGVDVVAMYEDSNGFVHCQTMTRDSADNTIEELEAEERGDWQCEQCEGWNDPEQDPNNCGHCSAPR